MNRCEVRRRNHSAELTGCLRRAFREAVQRRRLGPGQRLDVLQPWTHQIELFERRLHEPGVRTIAGQSHAPAIARQPQASGRVELRLQRLHEQPHIPRPPAAELPVERIDPCHHALDAANIRVRDVCGGSCREAARELGVAPVGVDLAIEAHLCEGARPTQPRVGRRARRRFDERQRGLEHGDAICGHICHLGDRQRLRDHFRLGRRRQQAHGRRRLDVGDEAEIHLAAAGCGAQLRDCLVDQRSDLAHVLGAVPVVLRRPLGELCARLLGETKPVGGVAGERDLVEHAGNLTGHHGEVVLTVRRGVVGATGDVAICVGACPIDVVGREAHELEPRRPVGPGAERHREDDPVVHPGVLAVARQGCAVEQEHAQQGRLVRAGRNAQQSGE